MKHSPLLTPSDIEQKEFKKTVWGYAPVEVVDFLAQLAKEFEKNLGKEKKLIEEIKHLTQELTLQKGRESEIAALKDKTKKECEEIKNKAVREAELLMLETKKEIEDIRNRTEKWLQGVIEEVRSTELKRKDFLMSMKQVVQQHQDILSHEESKDSIKSTLDQYLRELRPSQKPNPEANA